MHNTMVKCKITRRNETLIYIDKDVVILIHVHTRGIITWNNNN